MTPLPASAVKVAFSHVWSRISDFSGLRTPREVAMRFRKTLAFLLLATGVGFCPVRLGATENVGPSSAGLRPNAVRPYVACAAAMPAAPPGTAKALYPGAGRNMVRDGFGDESGAKLIEQRGIDFAPSEDFIQTLKAAGASEAFLNALRAAVAPGLSPAHAALKGGSTTAGPPASAKKPHQPGAGFRPAGAGCSPKSPYTTIRPVQSCQIGPMCLMRKP